MKRSLLALTLAAALPFAASAAEGVSYNYVEGGYAATNLSDGLPDADGWSVEAGARGAFTSNFEGYALAGYQDGDQVDGDFYCRLGATVKFNQNWGVNGDVKFSDGDTAWFVGPRFTW